MMMITSRIVGRGEGGREQPRILEKLARHAYSSPCTPPMGRSSSNDFRFGVWGCLHSPVMWDGSGINCRQKGGCLGTNTRWSSRDLLVKTVCSSSWIRIFSPAPIHPHSNAIMYGASIHPLQIRVKPINPHACTVCRFNFYLGPCFPPCLLAFTFKSEGELSHLYR